MLTSRKGLTDLDDVDAELAALSRQRVHIPPADPRGLRARRRLLDEVAHARAHHTRQH